jgi:hypothetical protein
MQEIKHDLITDPSKFELICLPCSTYQKKDGSMPVPKNSFLSQLVEKYPNLPMELGKGVEEYGGCPAVLSSIPNTPMPTKFATFPIAPPNLRAEKPDNYVYNRLKGKFKDYYLLPGWTLLPRSDMVEFASIKLKEIMVYYKLTKVAIPFDMFNFDHEDREEYTRIKNIMSRIVSNDVFIVTKPSESAEGTVHGGMVQSSVTYEEE